MSAETPFPTVVDLDVHGVDPPHDSPDYVGTRLRGPSEPVIVPHTLPELTRPAYDDRPIGDLDHDLTRQHAGQPLGEHIIVQGRVLGSDGTPLGGQLVEIWQANAAGRYRHDVDTHDAPLDPNFDGAGRCITDGDGGYRFVTVKPGSYPWKKPPQRMAVEPHPLLAVRPGVPRAARDPDVLPERPALRVRPHLQLDPGRTGAGAPRQPVRPVADRARVGARLPPGHRAQRSRRYPAGEPQHD